MVRVPSVEDRVAGSGVRTPVQSRARFNAPQLRLPQAPTRDPASEALANFAGNLNKQVTAIAINEVEKANYTQAQEAITNMENFSNDLMRNPENGYLGKRGKNAIGGTESVMADFDAMKKDIEESLANADQKDMFGKFTRQNRRTINNSALGHEASERNVHRANVSAAHAASSKNTAIFNYSSLLTTPEGKKSTTELYIEIGSEGITEQLKSEGVGQGAINIAVKDYRSETLYGAILLSADIAPADAVALFEKFKGDLNAEDFANATSLMNPLKRTIKAQEGALEVFQDIQPVNDMDGTIEDFFSIAGGTEGAGQEALWKKQKIDTLPFDMQLTALYSYNQVGVAKTKKMLEEAGGDPRRMLDMLQVEFSTMKKPPLAWSADLDQIGDKLDVRRGFLPTVDELESSIVRKSGGDSRVADEMRKLVDLGLKNEKAKTDAINEKVVTQAALYKANDLPLPASLWNQLTPSQKIDWKKKNPNERRIDTLEDEIFLSLPEQEDALRAKITSEQLDLGDTGTNKLLSLLDNPASRDTASTTKQIVGDFIKEQDFDKEGFALAKVQNDMRAKLTRMVNIENSRRGGKQMNNAETREFINQSMVDIVLGGAFGIDFLASDKPITDLEASDIANIIEVPEAFQREIKELLIIEDRQLRAEGKEPRQRLTEEDMLTIYRKHVEGLVTGRIGG